MEVLWIRESFFPNPQIRNPELRIQDTEGQLITDPKGYGSYLDIFVAGHIGTGTVQCNHKILQNSEPSKNIKKFSDPIFQSLTIIFFRWNLARITFGWRVDRSLKSAPIGLHSNRIGSFFKRSFWCASRCKKKKTQSERYECAVLPYDKRGVDT